MSNLHSEYARSSDLGDESFHEASSQKVCDHISSVIQDELQIVACEEIVERVLFLEPRQAYIYVVIAPGAHLEDEEAIKVSLEEKIERKVRFLFLDNFSPKTQTVVQDSEPQLALHIVTNLYTNRGRSISNQRERASHRERLPQHFIETELKATAPFGVEILSMEFSHIKLPGKATFNFVDVLIEAPEESHQEIQDWRKQQCDRLKVYLFTHSAEIREGTKEMLTQIADGDGILRDPAKVRDFIEKDSRKHSNGDTNQFYPKPAELADYTGLDFQSYDYADTKDIDDVVCALPVNIRSRTYAEILDVLQREPIRVVTAFANAAWRVPPDSEEAELARELNRTFYLEEHSRYLLGENLSCSELSLLPGKRRAAFVIDRVITPDGEVTSSLITRAEIKNRIAINMWDFQHILQDRFHQRHVQALFLKEAERRFRLAHEYSTRGEGGVLPTAGQGMIETLMIASKHHIAKVMDALSVPALFRVHARFNTEAMEYFIDRCADVGVEVKREDLESPGPLSNLLDRLSLSEHKELLHLLCDSLIRGRALMATENRGHVGLRLDAYAEIKALRTYVGLYNQWLLDKVLCLHPEGIRSTTNASVDNSVPVRAIKSYFQAGPFALEQAQRERKLINRKERAYTALAGRLNTFARIARVLDRQGELFPTTVEKIGKHWLTVSFENSSHRGIVSKSCFDSQIPEQNTTLRLRLEGWSAGAQRFLFYPES